MIFPCKVCGIDVETLTFPYKGKVWCEEHTPATYEKSTHTWDPKTKQFVPKP